MTAPPDPRELPYGTWPSPISAELLVSGAVGIAEVVVDGADVWWSEFRPSEAGRTAIVRWRDGEAVEVTPPGANVRTLVHEYGGGAWWVDGGALHYVELADQRLRRLEPGGEPVFLTPEPPGPRSLRFADGRVIPGGEWFVCIRESHEAGGEVRNEIVRVATDGSQSVEVLVSGPDFVSSPRPSPDGRRLAWIQWDHPNMPWDDTELWVAELDDVPGTARMVSGGPVAHQQPQWAPDGTLHVLADPADSAGGRWSVFRVDAGGLSLVRSADGEIGKPPWGLGGSSYGFTPDGGLVVVVTNGGVDRVHLPGGPAPELAWATSVSALRVDADGRPVVAAAGWDRESCVVRGGTVLRPPRDLGLDPGFLPPPERIAFPTPTDPAHPDLGQEEAYGLFYRPAHPDVSGPPGERPPLLVLAHGGPTGAARAQLDLGIRYWTSRGVAVVDVDYRGSTGYGRAYRHRLHGGWGVLDVADCIAAARFLAQRGDVDGERLLIKGGSAGGLTVLCALVFHGGFAAGAARYGVADLEVLARDTHKFESRYLDRLVGPYPEARDVYVERSPIHHVERLRTPMIVLQGSEDVIVPPEQSEAVVAALRANGVPHAYLLFEGEQHGFRQAQNIVRATEAELAFFAAVLGFEPAGDLPPLDIAFAERLGDP